MAILFFEGLPGAGKSYESMATQIIPALLKGREVVAYIEGLETVECRQRIAEASGLDLESVEQLLHPLTREDMRPRTRTVNGKEVAIDGLWIEKTRDNALHVFDEAQNWWPNRLKATEALTQFVTEHRHRGIDVLLMGQSLKDVLALWRRRVDQRFTFLKLTALGSDKRYRVTVFKGQGNDEFVEVGTKLGKYDAKYFGTYRSHVSDDTNTETFTDKRVNAFASAGFKYAIPLVLGLAVWGGFKAWAFFHPEPVAKVATATDAKKPASAPVAAPAGAAKAVVEAPLASDTRSPQEKHFAALSEKGRVRLVGLIEGKGRIIGIVEWMDTGTRVVERLSLDQLRDLGVSVMVTRDVVRLSLGEWVALATMWPIENEARVPEAKVASLRSGADAGLPASAPGLSSSGGQSPGSGLAIIDAPKREPAAPLVKQPNRGAT